MKNTDETKKSTYLQDLIPLSSACILSICGLIAPNYCLNGRYWTFRPRFPTRHFHMDENVHAPYFLFWIQGLNAPASGEGVKSSSTAFLNEAIVAVGSKRLSGNIA